MKSRTWMWTTAVYLFAALAMPVWTAAQTSQFSNDLLRNNDSGTYITFDVPGAGTGAFQGTVPLNFNPAGAIVGTYFDASNVSHGFLLEGE